jgi:hypothetical protein
MGKLVENMYYVRIDNMFASRIDSLFVSRSQAVAYDDNISMSQCLNECREWILVI